MDPNHWLMFDQALEFGFYFFIGACFGSFLNVCALRVPAGLSIIRPPSRCPQCGHLLAWHENIPLFSFLFLRGRCHACHTPISWQYFLGESVTGLLFALAAFRFEADPLRWGGYWALAGFCVVLSSIDMRTLTLPNSVVFPMMAAATLYAPWNPWLGNRWDTRLVDMVLGFLAGAGILFIFGWLGTWILGKDALGGANEALGRLRDGPGLARRVDGLFLGSLLSGIWGGGMILTGRLKAKTPCLTALFCAPVACSLPFGPTWA